MICYVIETFENFVLFQKINLTAGENFGLADVQLYFLPLLSRLTPPPPKKKKFKDAKHSTSIIMLLKQDFFFNIAQRIAHKHFNIYAVVSQTLKFGAHNTKIKTGIKRINTRAVFL